MKCNAKRTKGAERLTRESVIAEIRLFAFLSLAMTTFYWVQRSLQLLCAVSYPHAAMRGRSVAIPLMA